MQRQVYANGKARQRRFAARCEKPRVLHRMADQLRGGPRVANQVTVVGIGPGGFAHNSPGHAAGPLQAFTNHLLQDDDFIVRSSLFPPCFMCVSMNRVSVMADAAPSISPNSQATSCAASGLPTVLHIT